ncbi:MAG: PQQ-dependent sugar dehydrogenase [Verrucomicrobiales bacterium]|nr:PQQ-dependent sugar dehydrogenase [Verrucomicrobiales bacterium]
MKISSLFLALGVAASFGVLSLAAEAAPKVKLQVIYEDLKVERPISVVVAPDGSGRQFLVEQTGRIKIMPADGKGGEAGLLLDLSDRKMAEKDFEEGLLGLAFHPKFKENGRFYVSYSQQGPKRTRISEFTAVDGKKADAKSERILMEIQQPEWNHNSGNLLFGPKDGLLYICVGDGGFKNGIFMLPQKLTRWNGKVLRIDVDGKSPGREYGIPNDNPFVDVPNACPEIYAFGFRNPWGSWIDPVTGIFWLADVGEALWEEIDWVERGGNHGWEYMEGTHELTFRRELMALLGKKPNPPRGTQFVEPVFEYSHAEGLSITGGFVYRGKKMPELQGYYIYGDWKYGTVWGLKLDEKTKKVIENVVLFKPENNAEEKYNWTAFCEDKDGEVLLLNWDGRIFRMAGE